MRTTLPISSSAVWSRRVALVSLQLFILTILLHQFAGLATPVAMRLFGIAVIGAALAAAFGVFALVRIWRDGTPGAGRALLALAAATLVLAGPAWSLPNLIMKPRVTEVTTDAQSPPEFRKLARIRADVVRDMRAAAASDPTRGDPEPMTMKPLRVDRSAEETFSIVREAINDLGWAIVSESPPSQGETGTIEAVDRSLLFGITGDIALRIRGGSDSARVDIRSASRYVEHDLGGNAERVSNLFSEVEAAVAKLEKNERIARLARLRAERAKRIEEAKKAKQRRQWRAPSSRRSRSRSRRSQSRRQRTQELRRFWQQMER